MSETFKVAGAQFSPVKGDIAANLQHHIRLIEAAHDEGINALVFPEMSLSGYELELAAELAITPDDPRLAPFQELANKKDMVLCVGAPIKNGEDMPFIGLIAFQPNKPPALYNKIHVTETESKFSSSGLKEIVLPVKEETIGLAICADLGEPQQAKNTADLGASVFLASVLAADEWYEKDATRMSNHTKNNGFLGILANYHGVSGPYLGNGKSAIWDTDGRMLAQADETGDALIIAEKAGNGWTGRIRYINGPA